MNFYVHIVESPSPTNLLDGCTEGRMLCSFLELAEIPCFYNLAVDYPKFIESMTTRVQQGIELYNLLPILHLSMHGDHAGIQLTNQRESGELIPWSDLSNLVKAINQYIGGGLGICMSTCGGLNGRKMAEVIRKDDIPMGWIVGSSEGMTFCDAALAFSVFYRGLQRGMQDDELVKAVRAATGINDFTQEHGHQIQAKYFQEVLSRVLQTIGKEKPIAGGLASLLKPNPLLEAARSHGIPSVRNPSFRP